MQARPGILGLGLDDAATIAVHGDMLTVSGPGRVAVWDGADHDGKGYYYLEGGDALNTVSRVADILPRNAPQEDKKPAISEALAQRIRSNIPMPDSEATLRRYIAELQNARLGSTRMNDVAYLPKKMRRSLLKLNLSAFGALQSVIFKNVFPEGSDVYEVKFENVAASWRVRVTPDGKMEGVDYRKFHKFTDLLH